MQYYNKKKTMKKEKSWSVYNYSIFYNKTWKN